MKNPRLLPVVIAATGALLLLKSIGLVTGGGYVLVGTGTASAAGGGSDHGAAATAAAGGDPTMQMPQDATMTDGAPTLEDAAQTLDFSPPKADGHGGADSHGAEADHGEADHAEADAHADETHTDAPADAAEAASDPYDWDCPPVEPAEGDDGHGGGEAAADPLTKCYPVDENGVAIPLVKNSAGQMVPMSELNAAGDNEQLLLQRLGERRTQLDTREKELELRLALVEAAEKQLAERTAALEALQARIDVMVDQGKEEEKQQFASLVTMYENMKPRDAAAILSQLDMPVLLRVARAMSPRKMAPILAQMDPIRARDLTTALAAQIPEPTLTMTPDDLASLPQIVGR